MEHVGDVGRLQEMAIANGRPQFSLAAPVPEVTSLQSAVIMKEVASSLIYI